MNISYTYHQLHLIPGGILIILFGNLGLFVTSLILYNEFLRNVATLGQISLFVFFIGEPIIIGYAIYLMIIAKSQVEIQFSETSFRYYKNQKLKINVPVEQIEGVKIFHEKTIMEFGLYVFKKIEVDLRDNDNFQLRIARKKWISKFLIFVELLQQYCNEKQIKFDELSNSSEKRVVSYNKPFLVGGSIVILIFVFLFIFMFIVIN